MKPTTSISRAIVLSLIAFAVLGTAVRAQHVLDGSYPLIGHAAADSVLRPYNQDSTLSEGHPNLRLPSPSKSATISTAATLAPIVAALIVYKLQQPREVIYRNSEGSIIYRGHEGPDRLLPLALVASGVVLGPTVGYLYGGCPDQGLTHLAVRLGIGAFFGGIAYYVYVGRRSDHYGDASIGFDYSLVAPAIGLVAIGGFAVTIHSAWDLAQVKSTVRRENLKRAGASVTLTPSFMPPNGAPGLVLTINF